MVDFFQYLNLIKWLGLQNSKFAKVILGTSFEWMDLVAYTVCNVLVIAIENIPAKGVV
ncbi:MAG: DUF2809 domain-containing protein [Ginsengibacter sp.]